MELRTNVRFCVKLGKSASETLAMLREAYGQRLWVATSASSDTSVFRAGYYLWKTRKDEKSLELASKLKILRKFANM